MTVDIKPIEAVGLKDALKELNSIDKKLRRSITTEFKSIVKPVLEEADRLLPEEAPLSGMARSWKSGTGKELMNWQPNLVLRNLKAFTSGKKVRDAPGGFRQNLAVFGIRWTGPQATLFDMARKGNLSASLQQRYGSPSRVLWRAYETKSLEVEWQVRELVNKVMTLTGRNGRL